MSASLPGGLAPRLAFFLALSLAACKQGPDAPAADGDGPATVPAELPASVDDGVIEGAAPGFIGATPAETALILEDGGVCYVYERHAVRVDPIGADGEPRGDLVRVAARDESAILKDLCEGASRALTGEDETDTFAGIEGDVLLLDRASGDTGRRLIARDLSAGDRIILDSDFEEESVRIEDGRVRFGSLVREARTAQDLDGVTCPQGADFLANGVVVGVVQVQALDLDSREVTESDERTCIPLG